MRVLREVRDKTKSLLCFVLSRTEGWPHQHNVVVVARQLAGQWTVLEGRPQ